MTANRDLTRRNFLVHLSTVGLLLSHPQRSVAQGQVPTRVIPASGEALPVIGLGSSKAVLQLPDDGPDPLRSVLRMLVRHGGKVVDSSPRREDLDATFGQLLNEPDVRDELFVAVKIYTTGRDAGIAQMRHSQRLFGRRSLDLVQIESLTDLETHWRSLREWKETGEARHIGVTVSSYDAYERLEAFMRTGAPDFVHVNYSLVERRAEERLLPLAQERRAAVLINRPFMNGSYFRRVGERALPAWAADFDCVSWAQFSLKYILAHPAVTCVLTETTNPQHMEENLQAALGRLPDTVARQRMREVIQSI